MRREPTEEEDAGSVMEQDEDIEELPFDSLVGTLQFITGEKFYQGMYKDDRGGPYEKIIAFPADIMKRSYADSVEDLNGKIKVSINLSLPNLGYGNKVFCRKPPRKRFVLCVKG